MISEPHASWFRPGCWRQTALFWLCSIFAVALGTGHPTPLGCHLSHRFVPYFHTCVQGWHAHWPLLECYARGPSHPWEALSAVLSMLLFQLPFLICTGCSQCSFGGQLHEIMYRKCLAQYLAHRPPQTLNDSDHSGYFHFLTWAPSAGSFEMPTRSVPVGASSLPARRPCPTPSCLVASLSSPVKPRLASVP